MPLRFRFLRPNTMSTVLMMCNLVEAAMAGCLLISAVVTRNLTVQPAGILKMTSLPITYVLRRTSGTGSPKYALYGLLDAANDRLALAQRGMWCIFCLRLSDRMFPEDQIAV